MATWLGTRTRGRLGPARLGAHRWSSSSRCSLACLALPRSYRRSSAALPVFAGRGVFVPHRVAIRATCHAPAAVRHVTESRGGPRTWRRWRPPRAMSPQPIGGRVCRVGGLCSGRRMAAEPPRRGRLAAVRRRCRREWPESARSAAATALPTHPPPVPAASATHGNGRGGARRTLGRPPLHSPPA